MKKRTFVAIALTGSAIAAYLLKNKKSKNDKIMIPADQIDQPIDQTINEIENRMNAELEEFKETETESETLESDIEIEGEVDSEVEKLLGFYPYLKKEKIVKILNQQSEIEEAVKDNEKVEIFHLVSFNRVENLIDFIKLIKDNGYEIKEAEGDHSIVISKEILAKDTLILVDILSVANLSKQYKGDYSGWSIQED